MESFVESKMTFGPYPGGHCFRVESSATYRAIQDRVQMAEFLLLRTQADAPIIWIVEAKQSSPRPETQENFSKFMGEIRDKLANALALGVASILKRHPAAHAEMPELFQALNLAATGFRLVLVVHGHKTEWLAPLQDALRSVLHVTTRTWALGPNAVAVINHAGAMKLGLISAYEPAVRA
jgi:hypothetical protein